MNDSTDTKVSFEMLLEAAEHDWRDALTRATPQMNHEYDEAVTTARKLLNRLGVELTDPNQAKVILAMARAVMVRADLHAATGCSCDQDELLMLEALEMVTYGSGAVREAWRDRV